MTVLLLNHENALFQSMFTARGVLASGFGIPLEWVVCSYVSTSKGGVQPEVTIAPPPDGRALAPDSVFFTMTSKEQTEQIAKVMAAMRIDCQARLAELKVWQQKRTKGA